MNVALLALVWQAVPEMPAAAETQPDVADGVHLRGFILGNAGWGLGAAASTDLPVLAAPGSGNIPDENTLFGAIRQTRIGVSSFFHEGRWRIGGMVDADFYGLTGSDPQGGILESGARLVHAYAQGDYGPLTIFVGQREALFAPVDPDSIAYVSISPLTFAGNLWSRIPQIHARYRHGSGFGAELAFMRPFFGIDPITPGSQLDHAGYGEQTVWPATEGRISFERGGESRSFAMGVAGHLSGGDYVAIDPVTMMTVRNSYAAKGLAVDLSLRFDRVLFKGEFFTGRALAMLHSLGVPSPRGNELTEGKTAGGWGEIGFIVVPGVHELRFHGGIGIENPDDSDVNTGSPVQNVSGFANVMFRAWSRVVLSLQWTAIHTSYKIPEPSTGTFHGINVGLQLML